MIDPERRQKAQRGTAQHRKCQHEISTRQTSNAAHRSFADDDLPTRDCGRVPEAAPAQQELRSLARHGHYGMGRVAARQPVEGTHERAAALGWCGLRLNPASELEDVGSKAFGRFRPRAAGCFSRLAVVETLKSGRSSARVARDWLLKAFSLSPHKIKRARVEGNCQTR